MTDALASSPCPQCGELVPVTFTTDDPSAQSAPPSVECPSCGAALVRAVSGPADQGWRLAE